MREVGMIFKPVFFEGRNIDEAWFNGLRAIAQHGRRYIKTDGSGAGKEMLEFDHVSGVIQKPISFSDSGHVLPLAPIVPEGCPPPTSDTAIYEYFMNYLMDGTCAPNEHYKYGTFIVGGTHSLTINSLYNLYTEGEFENKKLKVQVPNQLQWCIDHFLKVTAEGKNYKNNHCTIQVGYPESQLEYDKPYANETERGTSPCLRVIDLKLIEDEGAWYLCAYVYFRAWNFYAWPENLGGIALLMYYISEALSVDEKIHIGPLSFFSKSLNVYCDTIDAVKMRIGTTCFTV
jgi:hypothetical protein